MKQKDIFLSGEGDAWYERNKTFLNNQYDPAKDPVIGVLNNIFDGENSIGNKMALEIGCGDGTRLQWIQKKYGIECHGLDPSEKAVFAARERGIVAEVGTADKIDRPDNCFDIVIFGFCLYLCDRDDLFKICMEADRVLRSPGWIIILDFYSTVPRSRTYHHKTGVSSYKMDYTSLFTWNPNYTVYFHKISHHSKGIFTDERDEWISTSLIRKFKYE